MRNLSMALCLAFVLSCAPLGSAQLTDITNETRTPTPGVGHDYFRPI